MFRLNASVVQERKLRRAELFLKHLEGSIKCRHGYEFKTETPVWLSTSIVPSKDAVISSASGPQPMTSGKQNGYATSFLLV